MAKGLELQGGRFLYDGKPVFISSIDCETLAGDLRFDMGGMLDLFIRHGFNKIRLWARTWHGVWTGPPEIFLRPWKAVPGPNGRWDEVRFDLDQWDDAYWRRLREFCALALERDFIVEISIFAEWVSDFGPFSVRHVPSGKWWRDELFRPEWNSRFNVNGVFTTNADGHFWPQFCDLDHPERSTSGKTLRDYQQAYLDKMIAEVDEFPNVYYELFNEFLPFPQDKDGPAGIDQGAAWQNHWAEYLKKRSKRLVGVCAHQIGAYQGTARGVEHFQDKPFIDVLNFHWFALDPVLAAQVAQPLHRHGKVIANNEGEWHGVTGPALEPDAWATRLTRHIWGMVMAGSHYSCTEFPPECGNERWLKTAQRFKVLRDIAGTMRYWELQPVDEKGDLFDRLVTAAPAQQWRVLANPGREYLVYLWLDATDTPLRITLPGGGYRAEWRDPRDGRELPAAQATRTGGAFEIPSPAPTAWDPESGLALLIRRAS